MEQPNEILPRDVVLCGTDNVRTNFLGHRPPKNLG